MSVTAQECMQAVQAACAMLREADATEWTVDEQAAFLLASGTSIATLQSAQHSVVAAFDAAGGAGQYCARTTASWLRANLHLTGPQAGGLVHTARALRDHLPGTAAAFRDGRISLEHVEAIRKAHRRLDDWFEKIEAPVADYATEHDVREVRRMIAGLIDQYDPTDPEDTEDERDHRYVSLSPMMDGWYRIDGMLDPATGQLVATAIDTFSARSGEDDPRTPKQRRADALAEIADRALNLVDRSSGAAAVTLTITVDQLHNGHAVYWPDGLHVSATDLDIHTCTANVTYVAGFPTDTPPRWEPLAVGFSQRYATPAQRRALAVRDGGCVHPGCTVRPERCIAHHIVHWRDGGPTDLPNLVLLCDYHHRQVHLDRIEVTIHNGVYSTAKPQRAPP